MITRRRFLRAASSHAAALPILAVGGGCWEPSSTTNVGATREHADGEPTRAEISSAARLQMKKAAATLLEGDDGAAVVDLTSGELLLVHNEDVVFRRAMQSGSLMKLFTAYALVAAGVSDDGVVCRGVHDDAFGTARECWLRKGHGEMRLRTALASSCNVYFYEMAQRLHQAALRDAWSRFQLGAPFGPSVLGAGLDDIPLVVADRDLVDVAVGDHATFRVTPLSVLRAVSPFAVGGAPFPPWSPDVAARGNVTRSENVFSPSALEAVVEGMREASRSGTLQGVFSSSVAAKTGTAKRLGKLGTRGWVTGFAPATHPRVAFVVVKDHGRGASDAGPAANAVVSALHASGELS